MLYIGVRVLSLIMQAYDFGAIPFRRRNGYLRTHEIAKTKNRRDECGTGNYTAERDLRMSV